MEVNPHPQADKLYVLTVDVGEPKPRTVVAGIRPYYRPEELTGHRVAVLTNLQPRTIRRMTSQGMVLAADNGQRVELVEPPEAVAPGQLAEDVSEPTLEIAYPAFESNPLVVGVVTEGGADGQVAVEIGGRRVFARGDWPVGTRVVVQLDGPAGVNGRVIHFARDLLLLPGTGLPPGTRVR